MKFERMTAEEYKQSIIVNEAAEQRKVIRWASNEKDNMPRLDMLVHIPNEGKRSTKTGSNLKQMGLKAGFPDLMLPIACGGFSGLYIEMKIPKEKLSDAQDIWAGKLNVYSNLSVGAIGAEQAQEIIELYLAGQLIKDNHFEILSKYLKPCMRVKSWDKYFGGKAVGL